MATKGKKSHKGQASGTDAWILVGLIGLIMLFYIMFLPPADREALLQGSSSTIGPGTSSSPIGPILVKNPGRLEAGMANTFDHLIPTFKVVELKNAQVLATFNPFTVKSNWLEERVFKTTFQIQNPDLVDAPIFVFDAPSRQGVLRVKINDKLIYEYEPTQTDVPPIMLRKQDLQAENTIEVSVSNVGLRFWTSNRYDITNPRILGDVSDLSKQKSQNIFTIAPAEKRGLQTALLSLIPNCDQTKIGLMDITLNGRNVYSGIPNCNTVFQAEIPPSSLNEGVNELVFKTSKGTIQIDRAKVTTKLAPTQSLIDYFELNQTLFNDVVAGRRKVEVQIDFVDNAQPKRGQLNVNGHLTFIDQRQAYYTRNINAWVLPGSRNYFEIKPETELNIPELRIVVK